MRVMFKALVQIELDCPTGMDANALLASLELAALSAANKYAPALAYRIDVVPEECAKLPEPRASLRGGPARPFLPN